MGFGPIKPTRDVSVIRKRNLKTGYCLYPFISLILKTAPYQRLTVFPAGMLLIPFFLFWMIRSGCSPTVSILGQETSKTMDMSIFAMSLT